MRDDEGMLYDLKDTILSKLSVLDKIERSYRDYCYDVLQTKQNKSYYHAIVIADLFERYYTYLETIFIRIFQHLEKNLVASRWHRNMLEKMRIKIDGIREQVISEETYPILVEFLNFRHYKRYYFDIEYDWDKLDFLRKKFNILSSQANRDIRLFVRFLDRSIQVMREDLSTG